MQENLTPREKEVFDLLITGLSTKEVGFKLGFSYETAVFHQKNIFRKMGVNNINEFLIKAVSQNAVPQNGAENIEPLAEEKVLEKAFDKGEKPAGGRLFNNRLFNRKTAVFAGAAVFAVVVLLAVLFFVRQNQYYPTTLVEQSFSKFHLRANRWNNYNIPLETDKGHGEYWDNGCEVSVRELPSNFRNFTKDGQYTITMSGMSNKDIDFFWFNISARIHDYRDGVCFGTTGDDYIKIKAHIPFNVTLPVYIHSEINLADFRLISLVFINCLQLIHDEYPDYGIINGSIPADIRNGTVMATISNFSFSLNEIR